MNIDKKINELKNGKIKYITGPMCTIDFDKEIGFIVNDQRSSRCTTEDRIYSLLKNGI